MQNTYGTDVIITINQNLKRGVESESQSSIFRVHNALRNVNERAYEPEIVAIGPFHRSKSHLQKMEEHKHRFLKLLLRRKNVRLSTYHDAMKPLEEKARKCYAELIKLSSNEFVEMMVLDGCFIIELFRKFEMLLVSRKNNDSPPEEIKNDPLFRMNWTLNFLQRDLMLFENQLPFFILTNLFEMVKPPGQENGFINLALEFFNDLFPGEGKRQKTEVAQGNIKHLLDLIHRNWSSEKLEPNRDVTYNMDNIKLIGSSTELAEFGIKFEKIDEEVSFDIQFSNGLFRIPVFTIEDRTESFLRNLMAYEQYCGDTDCNIVTDYMAFFSCLIKSSEDVAKLFHCGIIRSFVDDHEVVYKMLSKMNSFIVGPSRNLHYAKIFNSVDIHCKRPWNKWKASFSRKYMHSPWGIISIVSASTLLVLAFLQALFQILSWKDSV